MSAKIIFDSKNEIPEHLQSQATEVDGKWELDASGVLNKNKELLGKNAKLAREKEEAEAAKEAAEADATEWKGKAKIPSGQTLVAKDVAELGAAVKESGLSKDEIAKLKTENDEFKSKAAESQGLEIRREAAKYLGYTNEDAFARLAKDVQITKDGDKFTVKVGDESKPLTKEFVEKHETFVPFLSSLSEKPKNTPFPGKEAEGEPTDTFDKIRKEVQEKGEKKETRSLESAFGRPAAAA